MISKSIEKKFTIEMKFEIQIKFTTVLVGSIAATTHGRAYALVSGWKAALPPASIRRVKAIPPCS
jgi:hypothetical protein